MASNRVAGRRLYSSKKWVVPRALELFGLLKRTAFVEKITHKIWGPYHLGISSVNDASNTLILLAFIYFSFETFLPMSSIVDYTHLLLIEACVADLFHKIGRGLLFYFKPAKIVEPHDTEFDLTQSGGSDSHAHVLVAPQNAETPLEDFSETSAITTTTDTSTTPPDELTTKEPDSALPPGVNMVVSLLDACKRKSKKILAASGMATYKKELRKSVSTKAKILGGIIDLNEDPNLESEIDKIHQLRGSKKR